MGTNWRRGKPSRCRLGKNNPGCSVLRLDGTDPRTLEVPFAELFENTGVGLLVATPGHRLVKVNRAFSAMLGYEESELQGVDLRAITHAEDVALTERRYRELLANHTCSRRSDIRYIHRDGHEVWGEVCAFLRRDDCGHPLQVVASVLDISERKRAERALQESEAVHAALVRGLPDIVMRFDSRGRHLFVSANVSEVTELTADQFIGKTHEELGFPKEQCQFWQSAIDTVFKERRPVESEFEFQAHGRTAIFNWRLLPEFEVATGAVVSAVSISRDITTQRRAEADYQRLFREMLDGVAVHEILCNAQGEPVDYRFLSVNPAFERLTGLRAEILLNRTVLEVIPNLERKWIEVYGRVALTGEPAFFESEAAGLGKFFRVTAFSPTRGQFVCIFSDITEAKRSEEERATLEAQLRQAQKLESVGRLAGGIAHDFNNMVGVILGSTELAVAQTNPEEALYADLMEIRKAAERSAELTRQLLAFARQQPVVPKILDVNEAIEGLLTMLRRLLGERIILSWQPDPALWPIRIDPSQLSQVMVNLCANAKDAIAECGRIAIATRNVTVRDEVAGEQARGIPGDYVLVTVTDDGAGISRETLQHIFEPFYTTKRVGEGTGLGLATVYGIVAQNGGFVEVASEVGSGSTFSFYVPRCRDGVCVEPATRTELPRAAKQESVLLLEDDPVMLRVVQRLLETNGYQVLAVNSPAEAVRVAREREEPIELLVTDVVMPEMSGREVCDLVVSLRPQIRVLFMSGYTANAIAVHGVYAKGVSFIEKPFTGSALTAKIREVLGASALH